MFKILVVEDDQSLRTLFCTVLSKNGFAYFEAKDGMEAWDILQKQYIDLMISDIMMPNMDGYEAIRQIRDHAKGRNTPIIALTAKAMAGDRDKCINAGANDYLTKPVESNRLLSMIKVWQS